jgi:lysophospholipase L1-like esterase
VPLAGNGFLATIEKSMLKFSTTSRYLFCLLACMPIDMNGQNLPKNSPIHFLALGDSYTIGESVAEAQRWPEQLTKALNNNGYRVDKPQIVAVTGWRTDQLKNELLARGLSHDYDLVSLLIGVNNQYQGRNISEYEREFGELLALAIKHASGDATRVFVLSIPDYGFTPFGRAKRAEISPGIDAFNDVNRSVAMKHKVTYIDITEISRRALQHPDLVAADGLHPSEKMYALWVEKILREL